MPLDPQLQAMRDQRERDNVPPLYTTSLAEARAADLASIRESGGEPEPVYEVANLKIPGPGGELPLRLYRPASERPLPALLYFFGGGWVLGTIDTADGVSRSLANSAGALVAVAGYRLAPEHPFPAAADDCYAAVRWVAGHAAEIGADPARLAVGGDSAGGNLAAGVALRARAGGPALALPLLVHYLADEVGHRPVDACSASVSSPIATSSPAQLPYYLADPDGAAIRCSARRLESLAGLRLLLPSSPAEVVIAPGCGDQGEANKHDQRADRRRPGVVNLLPPRAWRTGSSRCQDCRRQPGCGRAGRVQAARVVWHRGTGEPARARLKWQVNWTLRR